jgi:sugar/nucleoside kinase (ribokinase family)
MDEIAAIGPSLVDISAKLPDHRFRQCLRLLNVEAGDWRSLASFEAVLDLVQILSERPVKSMQEFQRFLQHGLAGHATVHAGSTTFGMLSAMPKQVRQKSAYFSGLGALSDGTLDPLSVVFASALEEAGVRHHASILPGYNPVGFVLSAMSNPEKVLAMFAGVTSLYDGQAIRDLSPSVLIIDSYELVRGPLAVTLTDFIDSSSAKIGLSLGNAQILEGEVVARIRSFLEAGKIWALCGNSVEYSKVFPEAAWCRLPQQFAKHPARDLVSYALFTAGARGMASHWRGSFAWLPGQPIPVDRIVNTSGAGDAAAGAFLAGAHVGDDQLDVLFSARELAGRVLQEPGSRVLA